MSKCINTATVIIPSAQAKQARSSLGPWPWQTVPSSVRRLQIFAVSADVTAELRVEPGWLRNEARLPGGSEVSAGGLANLPHHLTA